MCDFLTNMLSDTQTLKLSTLDDNPDDPFSVTNYEVRLKCKFMTVGYMCIFIYIDLYT